MVTGLYAALAALLIIVLSVLVIKQRRLNKVAHADGGIESLKVARSAQSNAIEYIPITLLLMALAELNGAPTFYVHIIGSGFMIGRVIHAWAILNLNLRGRVFGMILTFTPMLLLVVLNLWFLPYGLGL